MTDSTGRSSSVLSDERARSRATKTNGTDGYPHAR